MLQAIVFDFDGTILDTETPEFQTWQEIYRAHGAELPLEVWLSCVGGGAGEFDPYQHLEELRGRPIDRAQIRAERRQRFLERVATQPILPGVQALIDAAEARGLRFAVASSSTRDWVESNLARLGLRRRFQVVRTADDVERVKPDPALYQQATEALGVPPGQALAIEDSFHGLMGARRAGLFCVAVPNAVTQASDFSEADLVLHALDSIAPEELLAYFDARETAQ